MAAVALLMGACSSDDNEIQQQPKGIHFTATIAAPNSGNQTRTTYTEVNNQINVVWTVNDQIALLHNSVKDVATVTSVDGSGNATIEATLTVDPLDGDAVQLVYPASSINADGTPTAAAQSAQLHQDGTLAYIQNNLDGRLGASQLSVPTSGTASLKTNVTMTSQIAIWKLALKNSENNDLLANTLSLFIGSTPVATATNISAKSEWYICYPVGAIANQSLSGALTINAATTSKTYTYKKDNGVQIYPSTYCQSNITMVENPTLSLSSPQVGQVIGSDGKNYAYASLPTGVTSVARICYIEGSSHGLALAMVDEGKMDWYTATTAPSIHTPAYSGGTWKLATKDEWENMVGGAGSYTALRNCFTGIGGTNLLSDLYWSSTENGSYRAWNYDFSDGNWHNDFYKSLNDISVRACLAW